jgi:hypothetical protein
MRRCLGILLIVGLVLAPAAGAKGPHAVLSSGDEPIQSARPWHATVELIEFGQRSPRPVLTARNGERRIAVRGSRGDAKFGFRVVFPAVGRWRLTLLDGKRRFVFPALLVGTGDVPLDYVAFPKGSMAERQGAGGVYYESTEPSGGGRDTPLPPETVSLAEPSSGGGFPFWVLPAAGVVLAAAGIVTTRAHR